MHNAWNFEILLIYDITRTKSKSRQTILTAKTVFNALNKNSPTETTRCYTPLALDELKSFYLIAIILLAIGPALFWLNPCKLFFPAKRALITDSTWSSHPQCSLQLASTKPNCCFLISLGWRAAAAALPHWLWRHPIHLLYNLSLFLSLPLPLTTLHSISQVRYWRCIMVSNCNEFDSV